MAGKSGHGSDLAVAGEMEPQAAHGYKLAVFLAWFANAEKLSQLLDSRAESTPGTRGRVDDAHFRHVGRCKFNDLGRSVVWRGRGRFGFLQHLVQFHSADDLPSSWYLWWRSEVESDCVSLD